MSKIHPHYPSNAQYTIAWVCVLPVELASAKAMLDQEYDSPPVEPNDPNLYIFGCIRSHNIVLTCLPAGQYGVSSIARTVASLRSTFTAIRFLLLVGIGGGVPSQAHDIRLGDVVVSLPSGIYGGVVQYDTGKIGRSVERTGSLNAPPTILLNAIAKLQASHQISPPRIGTILSEAYTKFPLLRQRVDLVRSDYLFSPDYHHVSGNSCVSCTKSRTIVRRPRASDDPVIHFGTIASGNSVIRDGLVRDRISADLGGVLCFEMEAAGIMNAVPCLVIRGICDYADSHKNRTWQPYAAATAAAAAKEILSFVPALELGQSHAVWDLTELHNAAKQGATDNAKRLLQKGANPNAKDSDGCTPMHYAAMNGQMDFVKLLLQWEVDETLTNSSGKSARDLATENGHSDISAFLVDPPVIVNSTVNKEKDQEQNSQGRPVMEDRCKEVCKAFEARVELNYRSANSRAFYEGYRSIYDLLYSEDRDNWGDMLRKWNDEIQVNSENAESSGVRWVHLPANNILWVQVGFPHAEM
ncbi:nucleoside phosphorylase domain-containing protein [Paraphoma chrysanthemicola]|uniref:Nucleoside phosphorylase domain-containing protein n=1 Tax=Paraphoma chrysanthemicola TaxID=798071 RepID=A0A8K0W3G7_9PLEO|nr:nucleoside phosphorylase domain-containing protein [Paraphoma chrysanthemicola]